MLLKQNRRRLSQLLPLSPPCAPLSYKAAVVKSKKGRLIRAAVNKLKKA